VCGRYAGSATRPELLERYAAADATTIDLPPCYNVAPTTDVHVVVAGPEGDRRLETMRWGLVPSWADDPAIGSRLINARLETVTEKSAFRAAFASRRCLVPADGYFEWYVAEDRQPYLISDRSGGGLAFGGVYEDWTDRRTGERLRTVAILTTAALGPAARLHDRMPVIVPAADWDRWLDPQLLDAAALAERIAAAVPHLDAHPVSRAVGNVRNDGPELLRADPVVQPALF
jgi:putative SOS response-associated peptidase YedK